MKDVLESIFKLSDQNTNIKKEAIGGTTTFMTMSYIIFVQPLVLSAAGMDFGAVLIATCISSAFGIIMMAFLANYPIAMAPGMGQNFFFTYTVVLTMGIAWQQALGVVFWAGLIFVLLSFFGFREKVISAIPDSLKHAIGVGIGLLITLIGLEWSGIVVDDQALLVGLGDFSDPVMQLSLVGLIITSILIARKIIGAFLIGIIATTILGLLIGLIEYQGFVSAPPSLAPTFFELDLMGALSFDLIAVIIIFLILDLFDTIGTLIGVADEAGFLKDGKLPRAERALLSDATATVFGSILGTSTVTSYIESASGVAAGARTGLANLFTAGLFLLAIFFSPLIQMIAGGVEVSEGIVRYPTIAPVLILVGIYMVKNISKIDWKDFTESIPAFMTIIIIPFAFRITEGIAFGFILYSILKLFTGRFKEVPFLIWFFAMIFILRYIFLD